MSFRKSASERQDRGNVESRASALVASGSLEIGAHRPQDATAIAALLPAGTLVYVNHLPRHRLADTLATLVAIREAGLEPVPHIPARRITSSDELEIYLERAVREAAIQNALVIAGDVAETSGPYIDGEALISTGCLARAGLREISIPGYPDGHPRISRAALERALVDKLAHLASQGLRARIVTQFSFSPPSIIEYCAAISSLAPGIPIYVGLAGSTDPLTLMRFAKICGVRASLRAISVQGLAAMRLVTHTNPSDQLAALARYCTTHVDCNIAGIHLFTFGGATLSAQWMNWQLNAPNARLSAP